jgi:hypothetical protein
MVEDGKSIWFNEKARLDFGRAISKGFWRSIAAWLEQRDNNLLPFHSIVQNIPVRGRFHVGLRQVPLDKVIGSVGRYQDFDRAFLPRRSHIRERWESVDRAHMMEKDLPPIEVYQVGEIYVVLDGNHRVSVAREKGQKFIDAQVTVIDTAVPIDSSTNLNDLFLLHDWMEFLQQTHFDELFPGDKLVLTLPGGYDKLLEHIHVHRWFMGEQRQEEVFWEDAVREWYLEIYLPLARIIRADEILREFPKRTEGDLYVWIIEHLWYLREAYQDEIDPQQAADHFVRKYARNPIRWIVTIIRLLTGIEPGERKNYQGEEG